MNANLLADLGYLPEEIIGKNINDLFTVAGKILFQTHIYPSIKIQKKVNEIFLYFLTKEKMEIPVLFNAKLSDKETSFEITCAGMQVIQRTRLEKDLIETKNNLEKTFDENPDVIEMRAQLRVAEENLESLLRETADRNRDQIELGKVISHDLQEPLRKIMIFSEQLLDLEDKNLDPASIEACKKIRSLVERMRQLLKSLEKFNALEYKKVHFAPVDILESILVAKRECQTILPGTEIIYEDRAFDPGSELTFISDIKLVTSLFHELIKNAINYKLADSKLEIMITSDIIKENIFIENQHKHRYENCLRIIFENRGVENFNADIKVFELFHRTNLGNNEYNIELTYCRRIIQMLNGKISVASKKDGSVVFIIVFPLENFA